MYYNILYLHRNAATVIGQIYIYILRGSLLGPFQPRRRRSSDRGRYINENDFASPDNPLPLLSSTQTRK